MKTTLKKITAMAVAGTLMTTLTVAAQAAEMAAADSKEEQHAMTGAGIGGVAGAVVGGPLGFVVGAAGGLLLGYTNGLQEQLTGARQEMGELQQKVGQAEVDAATMDRALIESRHQSDQRLDAISRGFAFNLYFRTNDATLEGHYQKQLDGLANSLKMLPELNVHVDAFADVRGSNRFNGELARKRADMVVRGLVARGIGNGRIRRVAYGESRSQYVQQDLEGMGFDRRVLVYFCRNDQS
ncbi:MAG: OmpA family protein [Gammaproteobacteria bacterium]|nr:OmpA family protein [Gammaproteobacteria bacterium]